MFRVQCQPEAESEALLVNYFLYFQLNFLFN